jgi:hypothetical protein
MRLLPLKKSIPLIAAGVVGWVGCGGSDGASTLLVPQVEAGALDAQAGDGGATDGGLTGDGGTAVDGGGTFGDAGGPGGDTTMIPCGGATCNIPAQVCCVDMGGVGTTYSCTSGACGKIVMDGGDAAAMGGNGDVAALGCTATANCAKGSICCIHQPPNGGVVSECTVGNTCGKNAAQLCDPSAAAPGCPASGPDAVCSSAKIGSWGLTPPFATCGGIGN